MRYKCEGSGTSFGAIVKKENIIITSYECNKKIDSWVVNIEEYLSQDTEYQRRKYLYEKDINLVKTEFLLPMADRNLDCIYRAVTKTLKDKGVFRITFADRIGERVMKRAR